MKQLCYPVLLPANEKAKVGMINLEPYNSNGHQLELIHYVINGEGLKPQHLYITSNEEIKEGDWFLANEALRASDTPQYVVRQCNHITNGWLESDNNPGQGDNPDWNKKIIATTDRNLILCRNSDHDGIPCNCVKVPQIPEAFVKKFVESQGKIISVLVEYEEY